MRITNKTIEKALGVKVIPFFHSLGIDCASRTGWCKIKSDAIACELEYGFVDIDTKDLYQKYDYMIKFFTSLINKELNIIIIEDTFLRFNVNVLKKLSRFGMIPYILGQQQGINRIFISPSEARKQLGLPSNKKKEIVHKDFIKKLKLEFDDEDVIDAWVLALNGVTKSKQGIL